MAGSHPAVRVPHGRVGPAEDEWGPPGPQGPPFESGSLVEFVTETIFRPVKSTLDTSSRRGVGFRWWVPC